MKALGCAVLLMVAIVQFRTLLAAEALGEQLEKLVPHAAGVALVEVVEVTERDARPSDGSLYLDVRFRVLRSSGVTTDGEHITKEYGGLRHPSAPTVPPALRPGAVIKLDTFQKGQRYWVAFGSLYGGTPVLRAWPEQDAPKLFEDAVRTDHYVHRPQHDPDSGLTHSFLSASDKESWTVRMEKDGKLLWEKTLPGKKYRGERFDGDWRIHSRKNYPLEPADANRSGSYLFAETIAPLEANNPYKLPAEPHRLTYTLEAESGRTAAIWDSIPCLGATSTPSVVHYFDPKTGKLAREERFDLLEKGGLAAGGGEEKWYRKSVRTYDPATGVLVSEAFFRHASTPEGSRFLPVKKR